MKADHTESRLQQIAAHAAAQALPPRGKPVELAIALPYVRALEAKDGLTAAHTWRVVLYTRHLAEEFGLDHEAVSRIGVAAALHDVGKLDIPDGILLKPGKLTDEEFEIIKTHPVKGHERLLAIGVDDQVALNLVRWHHERLDGKGYPDGIAGAQIPIGARFFSVIDTFDALTSLRPYRSTVGDAAGERALEELHKGVGTRYDPEAVEAFCRMHRRGDLGWIMEYFNDAASTPGFDQFAALDKIRRASTISTGAAP
ncbi:MAG: HD-GYP domain-containing protein [Phycisphaerales bacterium]|nr:HD-GYP domain-containing protein [Phycisphaerales bacterium]